MTRARALSAGRLVRLSEDGDESSGSSGGGSGDGDGAPKGAIRNATLSGASGRHLALELASWMRSRAASDFDDAELEPQNAWEQMELKVKAYYDKPVGGFFRLMYDLLQFSSGRDKLCAFLQNFAKLASSALAKPDSERHWMWRGIEDSMSDGRKIFRFFKEFREVYKMRRGLHRMQLGIQECGLISIATTCGTLDVLAHMSSFVFYLFDNLIWAASVGIVRAKEVPRWQRDMWQGGRRNGAVIIFFGGVALIKRRKNIASFWRIVFAFWANVLLLKKAIEDVLQLPRSGCTPRLRADGFPNLYRDAWHGRCCRGPLEQLAEGLPRPVRHQALRHRARAPSPREAVRLQALTARCGGGVKRM